MNILLIKTSALGDVVRTLILIRALRKKFNNPNIYWYCGDGSKLIEKLDKYDKLKFIYNISNLKNVFDITLSLEEDLDLVKNVTKFFNKKSLFYGFYYCEINHVIKYTPNTAAWNDMGLQSRFGINIANKLKKNNKLSFYEIWSSILGCNKINFEQNLFPSNLKKTYIAICPWAGERWAAKSMTDKDLLALINGLISYGIDNIILLGFPPKNSKYVKLFSKFYIDTTKDYKKLFNYLSSSKVVITADSLCLHLATLFNIDTISFYTVTSAYEIDVTKNSEKIINTSKHYCSYNKKISKCNISVDKILSKIYKYL